MKTFSFLILIFIFAATGCSHKGDYVNDQILKPIIGYKIPRYDEHDIEKIFSKQANLPKPFSVAVYFRSPTAPGNWRWTLEEKQSFIKTLRDHVDEKAISQVFLMDEKLADESDIRSIRLAAAKYRADSVLVVEGDSEIRRSANRWASTYILLVPGFFVNGNSVDVHFAMKASLWDVRNEVLYMSLSSEGEEQENYPLFLSKTESEYLLKTKRMALSKMGEVLQEDFKKIH